MAQEHNKNHFQTRLIHIGSSADPTTGAVIPPISLSTTYLQTAIGVNKGYEYSRALNPNRLALETLVASLEGADGLEKVHPDGLPLPAALALSSGSAATATVINALVGTGNHLISISDVYGGTYRYLNQVASQLGITNTMLDLDFKDDSPLEADRITARLKEAVIPGLTRLIWIETPTNPTLRLVDIGCLSRFARANELILVVDNTFLSPFYQQPIGLGADVVVHSATKYINGHSDVVLGMVVCGKPELMAKMRFLQNAHGAVPSAFDCWLAQRGLKTLALRMLRHGTNALAIARWLHAVALPGGWIRSVNYLGLKGSAIAWRQIPADTQAELAQSGYGPPVDAQAPHQFPYGGMICFKIMSAGPAKDQTDATNADRFAQSLRLFSLAESLGGIESLISVPALMTHASVSPNDRALLGIDCTLIRLSVGIEDAQDLIDDLHQAFRKTFAP